MKHDLYKLADQHHLNANEQQLLQAVLETAKNGGQCSVREFAAQNYPSPAAVIRLSKKMGYTGYTDMIYRIGFLIQNEIDNKNHASDITAFIGGIPEEKIHRFVELLHANRQKPILVTGTGFCAPLQEFMVRKLLVLGYCAIGSNSYEVYESGALNAGTGFLCTAPEHHCLCGCRQFSHRPLCRPCLCAAGRQDAGRPEPYRQLFLCARAYHL